ncbi:antitoxin Xre/MbcA/ParS toxin-binding domain-containing protein [Nitrospirillum sp. BR 11163]|uniref:type II RES/Xre toxin-antitoxin system antitoxin n=1 Tax=Nitrospirillum sp. BR 11163 TaxID=3104323 RepID=UPI002AFEA71E|nr:antitoxin Xre/MbcA/ParS toxin-binding domain-containing protein [Nitrospirillum sp. BR 11163]MEA1673509.1 antitoxin Xre/MbcA/ParS toxin-binding domain-containing protein [Nitrospirillum sp. BR 11163]
MVALMDSDLEGTRLRRVTDLLGGPHVLKRMVRSPLEAHEMLAEGLPGPALNHLVDSLQVLGRTPSLEKAMGISLRTFQRRRETPAKPLSQEQSGRAWKFAEILARASAALGNQADAERWLEQPAMGLEQRRPIDLLSTPAGLDIVEDFLTRLEYGVYA